MSSRKIGGFFPLFSGLSLSRKPLTPSGGFVVDTGRSALFLILDSVKPARLHLPFYLCDEIHALVNKLDLEVVYYGIDSSFEPLKSPEVRAGDLVYLVNYFGLKGDLIKNYRAKFSDQLIVDNTHGFFSAPLEGCWNFTNIRKLVGLPDGAVLSGPQTLRTGELPRSRPRVSHGAMRWFGPSKQALERFRQNEKKIGTPPARASWLSHFMMKNIDLKRISRRRVENFNVLHQNLAGHNRLDLSLSGIPFCYPLLLERPINRETLASVGLFVPHFWHGLDGILGIPEWELDLSRSLLPLPIDHRYRRRDMLQMVTTLKDFLDE